MSGKTAAGRDAIGADALWVDVVRCSVGAHPAHGALHVIERGGPGISPVHLAVEAIVDGEGNVSGLGEAAC